MKPTTRSLAMAALQKEVDACLCDEHWQHAPHDERVKLLVASVVRAVGQQLDIARTVAARSALAAGRPVSEVAQRHGMSHAEVRRLTR